MAEDALLIALQETRRRRDENDWLIRMLLAYGRELATPRPYRLADLAQAAGLSISGVRTAYGYADVERARLVIDLLQSRQFAQYWRSVHACQNGLRTLRNSR
jgi:AraC-like DNA-binding protein